MGGVVSDGWYAWRNEFDETAGFFSADFWSFMGANLFNGELWGSYVIDIVLAVAFAALGAGGLIKDLLAPAPKSAPAETKPSAPQQS